MEEKMDNFKVVLLGIIFDPKTKKILVGRRENTPNISELTWGFPGGRLSHGAGLDKTLKKHIKEKTGYDIKNLGGIFSKRYPEKKDFVSIYFLCQVFEGEEKAGGDFVELKWVGPEELEEYFTTSFHPRLKKYLIELV